MPEQKLYDIAVIGGGLAGLALSIQCAKAGYKTILFEKEKYPFHKVCGEYISFESWNFLEELGVPLSQMNLPVIKRLIVTAPNGNKLQQDLPLGGFGISRFKIDHLLSKLASQNGVRIMEETKVRDVNFANDIFYSKYAASVVSSKIVASAFGKRSNLDVKWKRKFILKKSGKLNNYVGVKYHVKARWPADLIGLHNFKDGYCGISQIEDGQFCLCYLTTAKNLTRSGNSIPELEKNILAKNPWLKKIFSGAQFLYKSPLTISQISFEKKLQIHDHILMVGDAAGMITPLCGNGMSMALHASKIAFEQIDLFLKNKISRSQMEENYITAWKKQFDQRLRTGRMIQRFFGGQLLSNLLISFLKPFPSLTRKLIQQTHGEPF
jgi:flavin-dependent dehydrogenase